MLLSILLLISPGHDIFSRGKEHLPPPDLSSVTRISTTQDFTLDNWIIARGTTVNIGVQQWNLIYDKTWMRKWSEVKGWLTQKNRNKLTRTKNGNRGGGKEHTETCTLECWRILVGNKKTRN